MAEYTPCVGVDVPQKTYVTNEEFKTFATEVFNRSDELKSSIRVTDPIPTSNPISEARKATTEALKDFSEEFKALKASVATKSINAINSQTSSIVKMKDDVVTEIGKYVSYAATSGYCTTAELKGEI